jgi:hypothetical protein
VSVIAAAPGANGAAAGADTDALGTGSAAGACFAWQPAAHAASATAAAHLVLVRWKLTLLLRGCLPMIRRNQAFGKAGPYSSCAAGGTLVP